MSIFRAFSTALVALVAITSSSCSGKNADEGKTTASSFKVALLTPGPISDKSWNGGAYAGLMAIHDSLGAQVSHIQTKTPAEFDENFRQYGAKGFSLVFGHGFEFQDAALRVAPEFPNTVYVTTSGTSVAKNVAGVEFAFEEASYLAGIVAGRMTKSNVLGMIGGTELPPVKRSFEAFEQGARSVNPRVKVVVSYIGNWDDVNAGKEQALAYLYIESYDVVVTDISMPGLSGRQLLSYIQAKHATTPVIVISGMPSGADGRELVEAGAFAYFAKPFNLDEIESAVERAILHHQQLAGEQQPLESEPS